MIILAHLSLLYHSTNPLNLKTMDEENLDDYIWTDDESIFMPNIGDK